MSFLFKSKKEREREERRERRRAFRKAENAVDDVQDRIKKLNKDADKEWSAAKEALRGGEKQKANRYITSYRGKQVVITKLEQKKWVFEQYLVKMESAQSDKEFSTALKNINSVMNIDPEEVEDVFEASQEKLADQVDTDRFWDKLYSKETSGAEGSLEEHIPDIDELSKQLEVEAASETGGDVSTSTNSDLDKRIGEGQQRIKNMLEKKE